MKNDILIILVSIFVISTGLTQTQVSTLTQQFKGSGGLSLDESGNLYIGDFGDFLDAGDNDGQPNNVWKLDTANNLTVFSGDFSGASGNAFDSNGILYQSDIDDGAIYRIVNNSREFVTNSGIVSPVGIVFDSNDNFYVCNCGNNTIRKVTPNGVSTEFSSAPGTSIFFCPNGITIDENDNLYVSNFSNGNIIKVDTDGNPEVLAVTPAGSTSAASNGHLDYNEMTNTLFIASHASNKIYALDLENTQNLITIAGTGIRGNTDGDALSATFSRPNGVAVTKTGDSIYINSAIPITNTPNRPLNPQVIRLLTGVLSSLNVSENGLASNLTVYPNPTKDTFKIEFKSDQIYENLSIELYDVSGRSILKSNNLSIGNNKYSAIIELVNEASGIYFYSILNGNKKLAQGKILKL